MKRFSCPYLEGEVELSEEREMHIRARHPEVIAICQHLLAETVARPDEVRKSTIQAEARLFYRGYNDLYRGKYLVAVVISESKPHERHWIVTAYVTRKPAPGELEWKRP